MKEGNISKDDHFQEIKHLKNSFYSFSLQLEKLRLISRQCKQLCFQISTETPKVYYFYLQSSKTLTAARSS